RRGDRRGGAGRALPGGGAAARRRVEGPRPCRVPRDLERASGMSEQPGRRGPRRSGRAREALPQSRVTRYLIGPFSTIAAPRSVVWVGRKGAGGGGGSSLELRGRE